MYRRYGNDQAIFLEVMLDEEFNVFDTIHNEKLLMLNGISTLRIKLSEINTKNYYID